MATNGHDSNGVNGDAPDALTLQAPEEEAVTREDILANEKYFPSFEALPEEECFDDPRFQMFDGDPAPICTWIFAADIVDMESSRNPRLRNKTIVRDRTRIMHYEVVFTHGPDQAGIFDFEEIINGRTLCLLCPYKTRFLDGTWGIVVDDLRTVKVIKNSLRSLILLSYDRSLGRRCETCKKTNPKLMCKFCKATFYCGRYCQLIDEKSFHVTRCNAVKEFMKLYDINFNVYVNNLGFRPSEPLEIPPSRSLLEAMKDPEP